MMTLSTRSLLVELFEGDGELSTFVAAAHLDAPTVSTVAWANGRTHAVLDELEAILSGDTPSGGEEWLALSEVVTTHLRRHLRPGDRIVFVPHRLFHYLPLHLLRMDDDCLIAAHAVSYASSASVLSLCRKRNRKRNDVAFTPASAAVIALDFEEEIDIVSPHFTSVDVLRRSRDPITVESIRTAVRGKDVVHFSAHGTIDKDPDRSGLILAAASDGGSKHRMLTLRDVYTLDLDATLVTLGACQTALGTYESGDEIIGLTRGFLYAGAPSVLASLWPVPNDATLLLMDRFYSYLLEEGRDKGDALRAAALGVRQQFPINFAWAGFTLSGDWI